MVRAEQQAPEGLSGPSGAWRTLSPVRVVLVLGLAVGGVVMLYLLASLAISADPLIMPLDDTYIHFQYARQLAEGHPWRYHPGDPASSGGTSLLYPVLLAAGYRLGFTGWTLAYWALGIGVLCHLGAALLVYCIARERPWPGAPETPPFIALALALSFAVSGPFVWAALSGMETALFVFTVLLALAALQRGHVRTALGACVLMVLTRPEALALAGIAGAVLALQRPWPSAGRGWLGRAARFALPMAAGSVQPLLNLAATGSATSSGMQAKSHLANTSIPLGERLRAVLETFVRLWRELLTGYSADWGTFLPWLLSLTALALLVLGVGVALRRRQIGMPAVMLAWLVVLSAGIATLDTAFWQFKRYQLPLMAVLFPAGGWAAALIGARLVQRTGMRWTRWAIPLIVVVACVLTAFTFAENYAVNVRVVRDQQIPMARWVRAHLPAAARIGAHDVGLLGYFSERPLYDVVGLTLPGPAASWRQGPGAIYEHMAHSPYRPDYFAIYPDVQGVRYLLNAGVFGAVLAEFPIALPAHNVAAATDYQAVYAADWAGTRAVEQVAQDSTLAAIAGFALVDWIDVADLASEAAHDYRWWQAQMPQGFVTEVYRHRTQACGLAEEGACWATDGGRVLTGGESFTIRVQPGQDTLLITRVHGRASVPLTVAVDGQVVAARVQPAVPGRWVEIVTLIPAERLRGKTARITIRVAGAVQPYLPYAHWVYQGRYAPRQVPDASPIALFGADPAFELLDLQTAQTPARVEITATWYMPEQRNVPSGGAIPDGVLFVHLYNRDQLGVEPLAQVVMRPGDGAWPPANWLPGVRQDALTLPLPPDLPPGRYVLALGFYDHRSGARLPVTAHSLVVDDGRLLIGEIVVEESSGED